MQRPLAVALTGGIAAGKSEALQAFARHGAAVISSDDVVHSLYREDEGLQAALRERWGERVFARRRGRPRSGRPDRLRRPRRARVARVRAPSTRAGGDCRLARRADCRRGRGRDPAPVRDRRRVALRRVVVVTAPAEVRAERRGELADREARLVPEEEKVRRADYATSTTARSRSSTRSSPEYCRS